MKKIIWSSLCVVLGITLMLSMAASQASASPGKQDPAVKGYDMNEYLDMLLATGQYGKYEKFIKISDPAEYEKHSSKVTEWKTGFPAKVDPSHPMYAMKTVAETYGFNSSTDTFTLLSESDNQAWVKVSHYNRTYYASLEKMNGEWQVKSVYNI